MGNKNVPEQRQPGQKGGGAKGDIDNRARSRQRGGDPIKDGAGTGKKPKK